MAKKFQAGSYKKQIISSSKKELNYKSFSPDFINYNYEWQDKNINTLLEEASRELGELNSYLEFIPDADLFIHMHVAKEATTSSRIEGTKTNINEAVLPMQEINPEDRDDWQEIQNYTKTLNLAIKKMEKLPLSIRLLKDSHKTLLDCSRGHGKQPGNIRKSQNWIGGSSLQDAIYIPPHHSELTELLADLEKYIHNDQINTPHLIKAAVLHYQFETIHPFLDGNGRLGRLLIILYLIDKKILDHPTLYLSEFFEKNKSSYYDSLTLVRTMNNMDHWIKFFLVGISQTARNSKDTIKRIIELKQYYENKISTMGSRAKTAKKILDMVFSKPVVNYEMLCKTLNLSHPTVNKYLLEFMKLGILDEITGLKKNRLYKFSKYLDLFK